MESHIGLAIYVLACMGMGVPVVLLSTRLSESAIRHLTQETGAKFILATPRLQSIAFEAISHANGHESAQTPENEKNVILVEGYKVFLSTTGVESTSRRPRTARLGHFVSEEDRQVLILHSSGTSGLPKPIPCSHRYFLSYATCYRFSSEDEARALTISTLPLYHASPNGLCRFYISSANDSLRGSVLCQSACPLALARRY